MSKSIHTINPSTVWQVPEGFRNVYSHATEVALGAKLLFISGQFGVRPDGTLPEAFVDQADQAMSNIESLLAASDLDVGHLVKLNYFLIRSSDGPDLVKLRSETWGSSQPPAVTVLTVSALARPEYLIEIEAVAAG